MSWQRLVLPGDIGVVGVRYVRVRYVGVVVASRWPKLGLRRPEHPGRRRSRDGSPRGAGAWHRERRIHAFRARSARGGRALCQYAPLQLSTAGPAGKPSGRRGRTIDGYPRVGAHLGLDAVHVGEQPLPVGGADNRPLGNLEVGKGPEQAGVTPPHHHPMRVALLDLAGGLPLLIIGHCMSRPRAWPLPVRLGTGTGIAAAYGRTVSGKRRNGPWLRGRKLTASSRFVHCVPLRHRWTIAHLSEVYGHIASPITVGNRWQDAAWPACRSMCNQLNLSRAGGVAQ